MNAIAAQRYIYIENQYFASAVDRGGDAKRLAEPDPPEIVLVKPRIRRRLAEEKAMSAARLELVLRSAGPTRPAASMSTSR